MGIGSKLKLLWTAGQGLSVGIAEPTESSDPIELFENWYRAAEESGIYLPEAMSLSTAGSDGRPSSRMVLLKDFGPDGFVFYTNYHSRKARELDENPHAALLFHWPVLQRQIRIEGAVERVEADVSDAYFASRGRGSRIGAWASRQSEPLADRKELEKRVVSVEKKFEGTDVPRPDFWGGFLLRPSGMEFWQGRLNRLHDRVRFDRSDRGWTAIRLFP
jgi:pyridoxamine 5'-phosphate oxidase